MSKTTESVQISIPEELAREIEAIRRNVSLERFVCRAVRSYICAIRRRERLGEMAEEVARTGDDYDELSSDLADEVWTCLEKDSLHTLSRSGQDTFSEN